MKVEEPSSSSKRTPGFQHNPKRAEKKRNELETVHAGNSLPQAVFTRNTDERIRYTSNMVEKQNAYEMFKRNKGQMSDS